MNILVTGGLGHIGSRLIRDLSRVKDVEVIRIMDNLSSQRYCSLFGLPTNVKYEFIEGDVRSCEDLDSAMRNMDLVFHLAAITDAPQTFKIPELTKEVNFLGTRNTVNSALKFGVKKFIYPSTTSVYGPTKGVAREDCEPEDYKPASPYAQFKLLGKKEVIRAHDENGLDSVVLRLGTIFGPSIGMRFHTAVNKFIFQACTGQPITVWDVALNQKRPYLYLPDAIQAFFFMMKEKQGSGEVFNVVTENLTVKEVVYTIKLFVPDLRITLTKSPLLNQMSYYTDDTKIRKLGFEPKGSLREGVRKTINYLQGLLLRER